MQVYLYLHFSKIIFQYFSDTLKCLSTFYDVQHPRGHIFLPVFVVIDDDDVVGPLDDTN